jgi:hypothetical protein
MSVASIVRVLPKRGEDDETTRGLRYVEVVSTASTKFRSNYRDALQEVFFTTLIEYEGSTSRAASTYEK